MTNIHSLVIKNNLDISKELYTLCSSKNFKFNYDKPTIIFNIQKTILDDYDQLNKDIYCAIKHLIKNGTNIFFLSYDTNDKRITNRDSIVNSFSLYKSIPKIYFKSRIKKLIIEGLYKQISKSQKYKKKIISIDSNSNNMKDIMLVNNKKIVVFLYLKYDKSSNDINKVKNKNKLYKLLKIKIPRKTKKQIRYNQILQNNIKKNMSLFKKGKYKSKKQAIAIAYQETNRNQDIKC